MKKPPSASVKPPIQTTQRVPMVSSKPGAGCGNGGGVGAPVISGVTLCSAPAGATGKASGTNGGGWATSGDGAAGVCSSSCSGVSGGGADRAAALASIVSSRVRSPAAWFIALRAMMNATMAIASAKKSNGESNMEPPAKRTRPLIDLRPVAIH